MNAEERRDFVKSLAIRLYTEQQSSCRFTEFHGILQQYLARIKSDTSRRFEAGDLSQMELMRVDVQSCTFLTRDTTGNYFFRHLSFMEYFVAVVISEDIRNGNFQYLIDRILPIGIRGFLIDLLLENLPTDILKKALTQANPSTLRNNLLSIIALTGIEIENPGKQSSDSSRDLLKVQFVQKDKEAFNSLYRGLKPKLMTFLTIQCRFDPSEAESIIADAFVKVWMSANQFDNITHFDNYIYGITRNMVLTSKSYKRRIKSGYPRFELSNIPDTQEDPMTTVENKNSLEKALAQLAERQRTVFELYLQGHTIKQIARKLTVSESTIQAHIRNSRRIIIEYLSKRSSS